MLNTPESTVTLTEAQNKQIETAKTRLSNLEAEITIAANNLNVIKKDVVKATEERTYQEELLAKATAANEEKKSEAKELALQVVESTILLDQNRKAFSAIEEQKAEAANDLDERENLLEGQEKSFAAKQEQIQADTLKLADERETVEKNREILVTATNAVQWN